MRTAHVIASATIATLIATVPASAANLLQNASFEAGAGIDADHWIEIRSGNPNHSSQADRLAEAARTGSFGMRLSYANNSNPGVGSNNEAFQITPTNSITPGTSYDFSFHARRVGAFGDGTVVFAEVLFLDSDGSHGGGVKGTSGLFTVSGITESFGQFNYAGIIAPTNSDAAQVSIRVAGGAVGNASAILHLDDVSFGVVPEPAALPLLGLGAAVALRRRRA